MVGVKILHGLEEKEIDQPRNNWVNYCAAKNAYELVKNVYTADAYYYNRGRLLQGLVQLPAWRKGSLTGKRRWRKL